jgi:hypothetical protein
MSDTLRFVIWVHRRPESLFGAASNPVIRNGALLFFDEEDCARAECDRLNAHPNSPHVYYTVQLAHPREADCSRSDRMPIGSPSSSTPLSPTASSGRAEQRG